MISRWQWKPNWVWLAARWAFSLDSPFSVESRSSTTFSGFLGVHHQLFILQVLHVPQGPKSWGGDCCQKEIWKSFDKKWIDRYGLGFEISFKWFRMFHRPSFFLSSIKNPSLSAKINLFIKRLIWFSFWWWRRCPQVWIVFAATVRQSSSSTCFRAINSNQVVLHTSPWLWRGLGLVHTFASSGGSSIILKMWNSHFRRPFP